MHQNLLTLLYERIFNNRKRKH